MKYRDENAVYDVRPGEGYRVDVDLTETVEFCKQVHTKRIGNRNMVRAAVVPLDMLNALARQIIGKRTMLECTVEEQQRVLHELNHPDYKKLRTWDGRIGKK